MNITTRKPSAPSPWGVSCVHSCTARVVQVTHNGYSGGQVVEMPTLDLYVATNRRGLQWGFSGGEAGRLKAYRWAQGEGHQHLGTREAATQLQDAALEVDPCPF